jgi:lipopolysaccharide transport system permease protein
VIHVAAGRPVDSVLLLLPLLFAMQLLITTGASLLSATAGVFFGDAPNYLSYGMRLWMLLTPIVYRIEDTTAAMRAVLAWNPLFPLFAAYQAILGGETPQAGHLAAAVGWAVVVLGAGLLVFLRHEREFAARV